MKHAIFLSLAVLSGLNGNAQETNNTPVIPKYAIKAYNSFSYQTMRTVSGTGAMVSNRHSQEITLLKPSIAFMWNDKKGNSREIELSSFSLNRQDDRRSFGPITTGGGKQSTTDISLRIEKITNFAKKKDWRLKPSLGFGLNPYVRLDRFTPYSTVNSPRREQHYGVRAYIAPRVNYNVSKRFFVDLNIPVTIATMEFEYQKEYVPAVGRQEGFGTTNFNSFPMHITARLGVGVRL